MLLAPLTGLCLATGAGAGAVAGLTRGASAAATLGGDSFVAMAQDASAGSAALFEDISFTSRVFMTDTVDPMMADLRNSLSGGVKMCQRVASRWSSSLSGLTESLRPSLKPKPSTESLRVIINKISAKHGMEEALVLAVVHAESNFDPSAVSSRGARGLMQLMPATAKELGVIDSFDPAENIDGGVRYLKWLLKVFDNDTKLALAAYNAGPTKVRRYKGIPPYRETKRYVKRVLAFYDRYSAG